MSFAHPNSKTTTITTDDNINSNKEPTTDSTSLFAPDKFVQYAENYYSLTTGSSIINGHIDISEPSQSFLAVCDHDLKHSEYKQLDPKDTIIYLPIGQFLSQLAVSDWEKYISQLVDGFISFVHSPIFDRGWTEELQNTEKHFTLYYPSLITGIEEKKDLSPNIMSQLHHKSFEFFAFEAIIKHYEKIIPWARFNTTPSISIGNQTKDGGVDLVAHSNSSKSMHDRIMVQIKQRTDSNIGTPTVREAIGSKTIYDFDAVSIITNTNFTPGAKKIKTDLQNQKRSLGAQLDFCHKDKLIDAVWGMPLENSDATQVTSLNTPIKNI